MRYQETAGDAERQKPQSNQRSGVLCGTGWDAVERPWPMSEGGHMWSIITWKSHLSPRRITLRPRWHPPSPVKGPSIGNPPTFIGGARCTFVTWPNTEQDRRQCSRTALAFKRLHLRTRHNGQSGATQSSTLSPSTRWNSRVLCVTSVAPSASAWQAIHRSFAPIGVPASFRRVNCSA